MKTVAVVRPEYSGQGELQDPGVLEDRQEVGQGEVSLLGGDLSVLRPVKVTPPAPTVNILRTGPAVSSLSSHWSSALVILCSHWMKPTWSTNQDTVSRPMREENCALSRSSGRFDRSLSSPVPSTGSWCSQLSADLQFSWWALSSWRNSRQTLRVVCNGLLGLELCTD